MTQSLHIFSEILKEAGETLLQNLNKIEREDRALSDTEKTVSVEIKKITKKHFKNYQTILLSSDKHNKRIVNGKNILIFEFPNGLYNYKNGISNFAVSVLHQREGKILEVLHYHPAFDVFLSVKRDEGVYLNGRKIRLSPYTAEDPLIQIEFSDSIDKKFREKCSKRLLSNLDALCLRDLRSSGSWGASIIELCLLGGNCLFLGFGLSRPAVKAINLFFRELTEGKILYRAVEVRRGFFAHLFSTDQERGLYISRNLKRALRPYPHPLPSVDALVRYEEGLVLIWRRNPPFGWALPGGFVEYGETLEEAIIREVREETGLEFQIEGLFACYSNPRSDPRFHSISYVFYGRGLGNLQAGDDALGARVFREEEIPWGEFAFEHGEVVRDFLRYAEGGSRTRTGPSPSGF